MRFRTELLELYKREKDQTSNFEIEPREVRLAVAAIVGTTLTSLSFSAFFIMLIDLPWLTALTFHRVRRFIFRGTTRKPRASLLSFLDNSEVETTVNIGHVPEKMVIDATDDVVDDDHHFLHHRPVFLHSPSLIVKQIDTNLPRTRKHHVIVGSLVILCLLIGSINITCGIAHSVSPVTASIALNASLNELLRNLFHVEFQKSSTASSSKAWASTYVHSDTEQYELFKRDVIYRRTKGFTGPLAFDVNIDERNPLNVLIIAVESFRFVDSLYISNGTSAASVMTKANISLAPNFDRWAKRGVAFNNMWSSVQTSRSLEAILFGQVNYDSVNDTGTTQGRQDTKLEGIPQFFER